MNLFLVLIIILLLVFYVFDCIVEWLNINHMSTTIPAEFSDVYNKDKYKQSQEYLITKTKFSLIQQGIVLVITLGFIFYGGFNALDLYVRGLLLNSTQTGVIYMLLLMGAVSLIGLPFNYYSTFVIEEKFNFNKSTRLLFFTDTLKTLILAVIIGSPVLYGVLWFFESTGSLGWCYVWGFLVVVQFILVYIAPTLIMPLFNTFEPLKKGSLKTAIEEYAKTHKFGLKGIFTMDGSKRSSKSNAYFTGFGNQRRIVLFDTLIKKHTTDELLVILAHEMGHFKKKHIHKTLLLSIISSGFMLYIFSLFINNTYLAAAFGMNQVSIYTSLIFFGFLYQPIETLISLAGQYLSRKHEFEADQFAVETTQKPEAMIASLKKLSADNLSNLTPHPLKVMMEYTHPPVRQRISHIRSL